MAEFHTLLAYENPALEEADPEKESCVDAVKSAACQVWGGEGCEHIRYGREGCEHR